MGSSKQCLDLEWEPVEKQFFVKKATSIIILIMHCMVTLNIILLKTSDNEKEV